MSSSGADPVEIPNRALFKAAEVCELAKVQPYVLRSWESEFQDLGVAKAAGGPRVYRRVDVEQVLRIKHLLLVEGLTLAGARRKLEAESAPVSVAVESPVIDELLGPNALERLTQVKRGLRSLLDLLDGSDDDHSEFQLTAGASGGGASAAGSRDAAEPGSGRSSKKSPPASSPRKKRSA